ncbi:MAG: hybrid sensor histidine kinase/response regulator [Verrucomicrobiota bacterium]
MLVVVAQVILFSGNAAAVFNAQTLVLGGFIALSAGCGMAILLRIASGLQQAMAQTNQLAEELSDGQSDELSAQDQANNAGNVTGAFDNNELTSLANSLGQLQRELTHNLKTLQSQARFLDRLEQALNYSADMAVMMDRDGRILFSNRAARRQLGLLPDLSPERALAESFLRVEDAKQLAEVLTTWKDMDREFTFQREDREPFIVHCIQTIVAPNDEAPAKIIMLRDITEHSRMKRQLYQSEKLAALGQLISGVAHELNNPLTAILGFAEICRDPELKKTELYENLEVIEHEAMRSAGVVENLLNFSRRRQSQRSTVNLRELLERCLNLLSYNFRTGNVSVNRHYVDEIKAVQLDEYQIQQVFMNLMINAAQAMREAGIEHPTITVATRDDPDSGRAVVEISDNGPGIPEEIREQIFSPFFTTKKEGEGTGLGLTVSKGIVEEHGGTLEIRSEMGKGTTFEIAFAKTDLHWLDSEDEDMEHGAEQAADSPVVEGRVLVMDDEMSILSMAKQVLSGVGLHVTMVQTLTEAQQLLESEHFDVIVADVHMPDGDGQDVLPILANSETNRDSGCIFITGNPQMASEVKSQHPDHVTLLKPFRLQDFSAEVVGILEERCGARESA